MLIVQRNQSDIEYDEIPKLAKTMDGEQCKQLQLKERRSQHNAY